MAAEDYSDLIAAADDYSDLIAAAGSQPTRRSYPEPKSFRASDVDLGIEGPLLEQKTDSLQSKVMPIVDTVPGTEGKNFSDIQAPLPQRAPTEMEGDPLAQMVVTGAVLGPIGRAAGTALKPVLGRATAPVIGAGEGAAASKSMGSSAAAGALLGAGFGALGAAGRAMNPVAAAERIQGRLPSDVTTGVTKAGKRISDTVKSKAGEGGANLSRVASEVPVAGKALKTKAKTDPGGAAKAVGTELDDLTSQNDAVYEAIQQQHGGAPVKTLTDKAANLWVKLTQEGRGVSADAVKRFHDDLIHRYGPDATLTAEQLRNIRNDIGETAFPTPGVKPNTRKYAENKLYKVFNETIEEVAGKTQGVDVPALKARNNQIATLIPAHKALVERAGKLADRDVSFVQRAKELPGRAMDRAGREIDYRLSQLPQVPLSGTGPPPSVAAGVDTRRRPPASVAADYLLQGGR